jgi:hypothetical protein
MKGVATTLSSAPVRILEQPLPNEINAKTKA